MKKYLTCNEKEVAEIISKQPDGKNTAFLKSSHNLWFRFKNYEKQPPFCLLENNEPVALVFATMSDRAKYINLYEIVTLESKERNGFASDIWKHVMKTAYDNSMRRLKISCTPSSVSWHKRNGLIFWAVDPSGSLRSDQPLFPTVDQQLEFRERAVVDPSIALPDSKIIEQFKNEGYDSFGAKKKEKILEAIETVKPYWLRHALFEQANLEQWIID